MDEFWASFHLTVLAYTDDLAAAATALFLVAGKRAKSCWSGFAYNFTISGPSLELKSL